MKTIHKIFVDEDALSFPLTRRILHHCPDAPRQIVRRKAEIEDELASSSDPVGEGKRYLHLSRQKGAFVKPCPCTPFYLGCNYFIINAALNCPLDCSYCILQLYLSNPVITIYANLEDLWRELDAFLRQRREKFVRIGTGELSDSLALDPLTQTSKEFIAYFRKKGRALFELKTKTVNIAGILAASPAENIILSWSLNSERIAREEERGAPSVADRIEAARLVSERGFPVGFHFDPLILYPGWGEDYARVVENLLTAVKPSRVRWISLGSLRFPAALKSIVEKRFPRTRIIYGEMIQGRDKKLRYFKPLRLELYQKVLGFIKYWGGGRIPVYFCMEDAEVWREAIKKSPRRKEEVELILSPRMGDSKLMIPPSGRQGY
jgi:spore photoproduct lyase